MPRKPQTLRPEFTVEVLLKAALHPSNGKSKEKLQGLADYIQGKRELDATVIRWIKEMNATTVEAILNPSARGPKRRAAFPFTAKQARAVALELPDGPLQAKAFAIADHIDGDTLDQAAMKNGIAKSTLEKALPLMRNLGLNGLVAQSISVETLAIIKERLKLELARSGSKDVATDAAVQPRKNHTVAEKLEAVIIHATENVSKNAMQLRFKDVKPATLAGWINQVNANPRGAFKTRSQRDAENDLDSAASEELLKVARMAKSKTTRRRCAALAACYVGVERKTVAKRMKFTKLDPISRFMKRYENGGVYAVFGADEFKDDADSALIDELTDIADSAGRHTGLLKAAAGHLEGVRLNAVANEHAVVAPSVHALLWKVRYRGERSVADAVRDHLSDLDAALGHRA